LAAIVRLAEPIALTSIFPYAWALVKRFQIGSEDDASFYAGLLISAFSLAEALMGMYWGGLSDKVGRKPVLLLGCVGTMFSMVMVGFASNIWVALVGRALGGLLNGNIAVIQTMVGELVTKPEHERKFSRSFLSVVSMLTGEQLVHTRSVSATYRISLVFDDILTSQCPSYGVSEPSLAP
jgi:MFS family permease